MRPGPFELKQTAENITVNHAEFYPNPDATNVAQSFYINIPPGIFPRWTVITLNTTNRMRKLKNKQSTSSKPTLKAFKLIQLKATNQPINQVTNWFHNINKTTPKHNTTKSVHTKPQLQTTTRFYCPNTQEPNTSHHQPAPGKQPPSKVHPR